MKPRKLVSLRLMLALLFLVGAADPANAVLSAVGPTQPNGFPLWYQDATGLSLDLCLSQAPSPAPGAKTGMCPLIADPAFNPTLPITLPGGGNFPIESFYFMADGRVGGNVGGGSGNYRAAVEGAFALTGTVIPGNQITFTIIRYTIDVPAPGGTVVVTHPYGQETYLNVVPGPAAVKFKARVGGVIPGVFTDPLTGNVGPYLHGVAGPFVVGGQTFLGDPNLLTAVTGSPTGNNFFRVDAPNIGGPGVNFVQNNQFAIAGLVTGGVVPTSLTVRAAHYTRGATSGSVNVIANSVAGATVTVTGGPNFPAGPIPMVGDGAGGFSATVNLPDATVLPPTVSITATGGAGTSPTTLPATLTDMVTITKATFDPTLQTMTVQATSSDGGPVPPTLSVPGFIPGTLTPGPAGIMTLTVPSIASPPPSVTVHSSAGGSATATVQSSATAEQLNIVSASYSKRAKTWHISGHTTNPGVTLQVFNSSNLTKQVIGTTTADALGLWNLSKKSRIAPNAARRISVQSSGGGTLLKIRVTVTR